MFSVNRDGLFCSVMWLFLCWGGGGCMGKARFACFTSKVNAHNGTHTHMRTPKLTHTSTVHFDNTILLFVSGWSIHWWRETSQTACTVSAPYYSPWSAVLFDPSLMLNSCTDEPQCSDDGNSQCRHRRLAAPAGHATSIMASMLLWLTTAPSHPLAAVLNHRRLVMHKKLDEKP